MVLISASPHRFTGSRFKTSPRGRSPNSQYGCLLPGRTGRTPLHSGRMSAMRGVTPGGHRPDGTNGKRAGPPGPPPDSPPRSPGSPPQSPGSPARASSSVSCTVKTASAPVISKTRATTGSMPARCTPPPQPRPSAVPPAAHSVRWSHRTPAVCSRRQAALPLGEALLEWLTQQIGRVVIQLTCWSHDGAGALLPHLNQKPARLCAADRPAVHAVSLSRRRGC